MSPYTLKTVRGMNQSVPDDLYNFRDIANNVAQLNLDLAFYAESFTFLCIPAFTDMLFISVDKCNELLFVDILLNNEL